MASRQCLSQKTVVWLMNKSREEAGFDATHFILLLYISYFSFLQVNLMLDFASLIHLCVLHKRDNKTTIELDNDQTNQTNEPRDMAHV